MCVDAGWYLSLSGTVSFLKRGRAAEAALLIPDDQLLVETDAPFLTPASLPRRSQRAVLPAPTRSARWPNCADGRPVTVRRRRPRPPGRCMRWPKGALRVRRPACRDTVHFFTIS